MKKNIIVSLTFLLAISTGIVVNAEEKETISVLTVKDIQEYEERSLEKQSFSNHSSDFVDNTSVINESVGRNTDSSEFSESLVPDPILREIINKKIDFRYDEKHEPTIEELQSITYIQISRNYGYAYIKDTTGLEHLTNLESISIQQSFVPNEIFDDLALLPNLKEVSLQNAYISGNESTISIMGQPVNGQSSNRVPFNRSMELGRLGQSNSIEEIYVGSSQMEYYPNYSYRARGNLDTRGLEELKSLKVLSIDTFASVNDENLEFIRGLVNLEELNIVEVPFTNADTLLELTKLNKVSMQYTKIRDYSNIQNKLDDQNISHELIVIDPQMSEKKDDKHIARINTGIVIPNESNDISLGVDSKSKIEGYSIENNMLYINATSSGSDFGSYSLYNPETNISDIKIKGILFAVEYTLPNGKIVSYNPILAAVEDMVKFELNLEDDSIARESIIYRSIDEHGNVEVPSNDDFGLNGFEISGWYRDIDLTIEETFENPFTQSTTLFAKLDKNKYLVNFDSVGGSEVSPVQVTKGYLLNKPDNPTKDNYTFDAWYKDGEFNESWNFESDTVKEDITLFARWVLNTNPVEPVDPVDPVDPVEPVEPVEPVAPVNPQYPTDPSDSTSLIDDEAEVRISTNELPKTGVQSLMLGATLMVASGCVIIIISKRKRKV